MSNIKPYLTAFRMRARQETQYRTAALGGIVTQLFFGVILVALYAALTPDPALLRQTAAYVWLQQIFFRAMFASDDDFAQQIMQGEICYTLMRPVDLHLFATCRELAGKLALVALRTLPMLAAQILLPVEWRLLPPASAGWAALSLASLLVGLVCVSQVNMICHAVTMRTLDNRGITGLINLVMMILCGNIIPLTLFPDRLQTFIRLQPFAQLLDAPIRMYLGAMAAAQYAQCAAVQVTWLVIFWLAARWMWRRNIRRLEVQGG